MLPLILSLLKSLEAFLSIKSVRAKWELERDIARYCDEVQNDILKARSAGDDARADILHQRFLSSSGLSISSQRDIEAVPGAVVHGSGK
jgi:hypothetical protein